MVVTDVKLAKLMRAAMFPGQPVEERVTLHTGIGSGGHEHTQGSTTKGPTG